MVEVFTVIAAVGCGMLGGVMFAFSTSVLPGLRRLPPEDAVAAMRGFNAAILNPVFLLTFLGATVCCAGVLVLSLFDDVPAWPIVGAAVFLVGGFGVTAAANVPLNNRLERDDSADFWRRYARR